jgi:uncharacterized protein involved in exopolysaccharide biosynthesis
MRAMENRVAGGNAPGYDDELNLREYVVVLWRWKYVITAVMIVFALAGFLVSRSLTPLYQASARLIINNSKTGDQVTQLSAATIAGHRALLQSPVLAQRVVKEMGLDAPPHNFTPQTFLNGAVSSEVLGITNILIVHVTLSDPELAAKTATAFAKSAVDLAQQLNQEETLSARDIIKIQVDESEKRMASARVALEAFQKEAQIELLRKDVDAILGQRGALLALLVEIESERARLAMAESQLSKATRVDTVRRSVVTDPAMTEAARNRDGADRPANVLPLEMRNEFINSVYETLEGQVAVSRTRLAGLEKQKSDLVDVRKLDAARVVQLNDLYRKEGELRQLQTEFDLARNIYLEVATKYQEARLQVASRGAQLQVLDEALVPEFRIAPRIRTNTMLAAIVGLLGAIIVVLIRHTVYSDRRLTAV